MEGTCCPDQLRLAELAMEQSYQAIYWIHDRRIIHANRAACQALGYSPQELNECQVGDIYPETAANNPDSWWKRMRPENVSKQESVHRRRDGSLFPVEVSIATHDISGETYTCLIAQDITERKKTEQRYCAGERELQNTIEDLRESEERYRAIIDTSFDIIITSENGIIREVNEAFATLSGYDQEAAIGMRLADMLTAESGTVSEENILAEKNGVYELVGRRKDGKLVDVEVVGRTIHQKGRKLRLSAIRDISVRKHSERNSVASQKRLDLAMEGGRLGIFEWVLAEDGGAVSDSFFRLFGREPRSVRPTYRMFAKLTHPDDLRRLERIYGVAQRTGRAIAQEARIYWPDGSLHWVEVRARFTYDSDGNPVRLDGVMVDIDEKKEAEKKFQQSQLNLSMAMESGNMGTYEWDVMSRCLEFSPGGSRVTGWNTETESIPFRTWLRQVHPNDRAAVVRTIAKARRDRSEVTLEHRVKNADGVYQWIEGRGRFTYDRSGAAVRMCGVVANIDHRKQAEEELRLHRFAVDVAAEAMFTIRTDGSIVDVNQTACDRLGYSREELLKLSVPDFSSFAAENFNEHVAALRQTTSRVVQTSHRRKDGSLFDVEVSARMFEYEGHEYICATARDVTELRRAEKENRELDRQLAHVNRLNCMGEMASTIAHELNQPLYVISNLAALLQYSAKTGELDSDETNRMMETIGSQAVLAGEIVRRMRGFCMNKPPTQKVTDLRELIRESIRLLEPELRHSNVRTETDFRDAPKVLIDRVQIQQVLVNLVHNAIEAMAETPRNDRYLKICTHRYSRQSVRISVSDHGPGIALPCENSVFEPFVTTKENGMGMGLAISRSIIEAHKGRLAQDEDAVGGTTFHIDIPVSKSSAVTV